jgi:hypothetical protein
MSVDEMTSFRKNRAFCVTNLAGQVLLEPYQLTDKSAKIVTIDIQVIEN